MKNSLLFDFAIDKAKNQIVIKREVNAAAALVWEAWTKSEVLDQWWAPKPYKTMIKSLEFNVEGTWLYAMVSPQNEKHWCKAIYKAIEPITYLSWLDAFCDESGNESEGKPQSLWLIRFTEREGVTTIDIVLQHNSYEEIEMMLQMGFKEGFEMCLGNLDELLASGSK